MPNPVRIADDTRSLHNIGEYIMQYEAHQNAFVSSLVNRISRVLVTSKLWSNPWAAFKKGKLEMGETVEEIFANIAHPYSYDPGKAESSLFKREMPDVRAAFHSMNYQKYYPVTISQAQLRQAFISYSEMNSLISYITDSLYTAMNLDEYLTMKYMMAREIINGGVYPVQVASLEDDATDVIRKFREYTNNLTFLKTTYNRAHVRNATPVESQVIFIPNAAEATLGVDVLANAFNINQVDYISSRVAVDSFSFDEADLERLGEIFADDKTYVPFTDEELEKLESVIGFKCDRDWFMIFDNMEQMSNVYNPKGLYWNYFLHKWQTFSVSPFANALIFTSEDVSITSVSVSPSSATVANDSSTQFTATVSGTGLYDQTVTWSIEGDVTPETQMNALSGVLNVGHMEPSGTEITVIATAADGTVGKATATVA